MKKITALGFVFSVAIATAGTAAAQVKFGVGGPITGPSAATGAQMKNGVDQAAADINAAGGILGQKITVSYGDDASDPKQGVSVANKFSADGVNCNTVASTRLTDLGAGATFFDNLVEVAADG